MRILDLFKRAAFPVKSLSLDETQVSTWPERAIRHAGLDTAFTQFRKDIEDSTDDVTRSLAAFSDEGILAAIPDRARTMNAVHGGEYAQQVAKLLKGVSFSHLWSFDRDQDAFFERMNGFKDQTAKNISVLREFLHDELKVSQECLQRLEDRVISFSKVLEEQKFPAIRKMRDLVLRAQASDERAAKYKQLLTSLESDLKRTQDKRVKLEQDIKAQVALVRNTESLAALDKIAKIDVELHRIATQYASASHDAKAVFVKHPEYEMPQDMKRVLDELPKDPAGFLTASHDAVTREFENVIALFEEHRPGNIGRLIERLTRLAQHAETESRLIQTSLPDQRAHKRLVMKDIAALNVYDKRQFLLRAQTEEETISGKITFITQELDPKTRIAMMRELKDLARSIGAVVVAHDDNAPEEKKTSDGKGATRAAAPADDTDGGDDDTNDDADDDTADSGASSSVKQAQAKSSTKDARSSAASSPAVTMATVSSASRDDESDDADGEDSDAELDEDSMMADESVEKKPSNR